MTPPTPWWRRLFVDTTIPAHPEDVAITPAQAAQLAAITPRHKRGRLPRSTRRLLRKWGAR